MKRLKSFFITAVSIIGSAFFAVVLTPEWSSFLQYANDKIASWGVPAVVIALIGVFISEIWKGILNNHTISKAKEKGYAGGDFIDYNNNLY